MEFDMKSAYNGPMIGKILTLKGISQHGKNRVREKGNPWRIEGVAETVHFSSRLGPWLLIISQETGDSRWIQKTNDKDFEIVSIQ